MNKLILVVFTVFLVIEVSNANEQQQQLRPAAIIPWSQYQQRLSKAKQQMAKYNEQEGDTPSFPNPSLMSIDNNFHENSYFGSYEKPNLLPEHLAPAPSNEASSRTTKLRNVIRPQVRGRLPAEPSDFAKYMKKPEKEYLGSKLRARTMEQTLIPAEPNSLSKTKATDYRLQNKISTIAIPNGVPMNAAHWENGQPNYRRPAAHAANTFTNTQNFQNLVGSEATAPIYEKANSNIVSSIFSQSQAGSRLIPTMTQPSQGQAYFEKMLADGASFEQISKLAKNLLGVGGNGEGGQSGSGGLIEAMTSALRGAARNPPTSSAVHDGNAEYTSAAASRPQPSVLEKLLSHAAVALNDSLKQKQKEEADKALMMKKVEEAKAAETQPPQRPTKLSKDKENSLKLLEGMPEEQRKILEKAIISGEIDPESSAIKNLVKDDMTEESKREKQSRLLEWITSNRPSKPNESSQVSDKLPYYGKYLGTFSETPNVKKQLHPSGGLWAVDEKRFIVSKFMFQPGSLLNENVTFWLGPETPSGNILQDIMPSENGFYVQPRPLDVSLFAIDELPAIEAKQRQKVSSVTLIEGVPPIVANVSTIRLRRSVRKPIELQVEGGVIQLMPGKGDVVDGKNFTEKEETKLSSSSVVIPAGFRLKQPEFDNVDQNVPQPLDWYAGFQPLLLTIPGKKTIKDLNWVALRDHKRQETIASILLPNGPLFQLPKVVQLRPLSPNNPTYNISSGSIQIIDIKTMRINNFSFKSDDDLIWFMVGKDIIPNVNGHIVPIFDERRKTFDCQSLKDYHNETITLRLPGQMDMRDVFWFSIFSMKHSISYSHVYLPYHDMTLIPDFSAVATPPCKYISS
ncbi:unnamed protein product [Caenorhabditis bovis]|uniref:DM13 domain-containing protein n=1 Tax=Caenorhabditis bovis TaxID=2654633 RepID=A0A8S1FC74_9PELO|nr:unnamed protein product [Caenorhabditis bovis]